MQEMHKGKLYICYKTGSSRGGKTGSRGEAKRAHVTLNAGKRRCPAPAALPADDHAVNRNHFAALDSDDGAHADVAHADNLLRLCRGQP
jgi:hypothetical protein